MVHAPYRSMNASVRQGAADGTYKQVNNGRVNAEPATYESREDLDDVYYGIHEKDIKWIPGFCEEGPTPTYVPTRIPDSTKW